jgi:hypothetical protein
MQQTLFPYLPGDMYTQAGIVLMLIVGVMIVFKLARQHS